MTHDLDIGFFVPKLHPKWQTTHPSSNSPWSRDRGKQQYETQHMWIEPIVSLPPLQQTNQHENVTGGQIEEYSHVMSPFTSCWR